MKHTNLNTIKLASNFQKMSKSHVYTVLIYYIIHPLKKEIVEAQREEV